jgi:hypothetical protein
MVHTAPINQTMSEDNTSRTLCPDHMKAPYNLVVENIVFSKTPSMQNKSVHLV